MKGRSFRLYQDLFTARIRVFLSDDVEILKRYLQSKDINDYDVGGLSAGKCLFIANDSGASETLIWFNSQYVKNLHKGDAYAWSVIAHESYHAARRILKHVDITDDDEPRAYLTDWLVARIGRKLVKSR